ncbi:MAG: type II toxin-antitoxin system RelE/ParE family toxin [Bacteroidota bacterium]
MEDLESDPRPTGCKRLRGETSLWRIRVGDYRVIYSIDDEIKIVLVTKVGSRGDVYKDL